MSKITIGGVTYDSDQKTILSGALASRPAANTVSAGTEYRDTTNLGDVYESDGNAWAKTRSAGSVNSRPSMTGAVFASGTLVDGVAVDVPMAGAPMPCTLAVKPAAGDTISIYYTVNGTDYTLRAEVTVYTEDVIDAPVLGLRFQRTVGTGITSTWAVV